ncbi:MAG: NAD(P)/FAD-dependent oxidoreductase [Candidatus Protistobacter heckmanni]|nr:NAD(P)/FAD-dependent oxidoreductase [Candidatus Protistobacter heckmanni]
MTSPAAPIETDALVVGAGPVGLFQVFQLGLLEIRAHVVEARPDAGGQCAELYPDKPIYDIPGLPLSTGQDLSARLLEQARPFSPVFHYGQQVASLARRADGRFDVETSGGLRFTAKTVVIAAGVGAFLPRALKIEGIDAFAGTQLVHRPEDIAAPAGRRIAVCGGGEAALEAAGALARAGAQVTLVHRRRVDTPEGVAMLAGQPECFEAQDGRLGALRVLDNEGASRALPLDMLLVMLGISPKLGPIADWGLAMERKQLQVNTADFSTSLPGVFAVGDVNTYPGKKKLIVCGFHEATLAAYGAAAHVFPGKAIQLQYTTTSPRLHALLGVNKA